MDDQTRRELECRLEAHRSELVSHCRRILKSALEAEDAAQETLVRAWSALDRLENPDSLRSWLYRIATNVCLDMRDTPQRRARPVDPASWLGDGAPVGTRHAAAQFALNLTDDAGWGSRDPAERAVTRDAIAQALEVTLVHLPPRQRLVLILREVLRWRAAEVAELLDTSVASVNTMLKRARSRIAVHARTADEAARIDNHEQRAFVRHQVDALERHDMDAFVFLLRWPQEHATAMTSQKGIGELSAAGPNQASVPES